MICLQNQSLSCETKDGILIVRILPVKTWEGVLQLSSELRDVCTNAILDSDTRVVVLTGAEENAFLMDPQKVSPGSEDDPFQGASIGSLSDPISRLDMPVLAAIHGDATGQGLELALACDLRIASENSRFGLTQIKAGSVPGDGGTQRLSRLVGKAKAMEMILTGEILDAREALRIGLVSRLVPRGEVTTTVMGLAQEMASRAPIAVRYAKETICKGMDMTLEQGLRLEADLYFLLHTTRDRTEGIQAFRSKRTPTFEGK
jgi:enoyl-CoA hydratase/carnithine racemase